MQQQLVVIKLSNSVTLKMKPNLLRPKLKFAVSVVAGGSDVVERMMESRRRLQNGVRPRARLPSQLVE